RTRLTVAGTAIRRSFDVGLPEVREASELAISVVPDLPRTGRPLFAAHAALPIPEQSHLALWWAASCLREFRGDGHIAALLVAGLDGLSANVLAAAVGAVDPVRQQQVRGWDDQQWHEGIEALARRGLVNVAGEATQAGRE